ncbi:uncharacterized protein BT62DRAFT_386493 [Guyanagaster necrorhizus]|uniref:Uncharacterized protein n=1 Tax=Guyanagaster necrorhizus TaxID=856835 RepID=A0A9P7VKS2_9AGAR|nr:uncharacterized protein BT62DRAFT_386493 [Guyanagaster necrorhizus MCA 3950]KAG7442524.1 hypothetical protein BT62DRAFT_386493 [Guyanagaster necrorhizus MCA 3950]
MKAKLLLAYISSRNDNALRRVETGISSIVGAKNGGLVLVIDGAAMDYASTIAVFICAKIVGRQTSQGWPR